MRPGIRLQIIVALAGLLVLAFLPLYFAVTSLARYTLQSSRETTAVSLGRAVASRVSYTRLSCPEADFDRLLSSELGHPGLVAIAIYDKDGSLIQSASDPTVADAVSTNVPVDAERSTALATASGPAIEIVVPGSDGPVLALVRPDYQSRLRPLVRLIALYTICFAVALLLFTYIALTRLIVRPIERLADAASRVSLGESALDVPRDGAREIAALGSSLVDMMVRLRSDEESLRVKVRELEVATDQLRASHQTLVRSERLASVGRLSAGLAHEIGNPMAVIIGFVDLLCGTDTTEEERRDYLIRVRKETERVHRTLRHLLDFARTSSVMLSDHTVGRCDPRVVVRDACELMRPQRSFRSIDIACDVDDAVPMVVMSSVELTQILVNLLLNAADAIASGGAGSAGETGRVWVRLRRDDSDVRGVVVLEVEDDGHGVPSGIRDSLFEPFVTTKGVGAGTGLGLAVCRELANGSGGSIRVEDGAFGGARFVLTIMAAAVADVVSSR